MTIHYDTEAERDFYEGFTRREDRHAPPGTIRVVGNKQMPGWMALELLALIGPEQHELRERFRAWYAEHSDGAG